MMNNKQFVLVIVLIIASLAVGAYAGISVSRLYYCGYQITGNILPTLDDIKALHDDLGHNVPCNNHLVNITVVPKPNYRISFYYFDFDQWQGVNNEWLIYKKGYNNMPMCSNHQYILNWGESAGPIWFYPTETEYTLYDNGTVMFMNGTIDITSSPQDPEYSTKYPDP